MVRHAGIEIQPNNPLIVGVINISPESFYKESVAFQNDAIENKIKEFAEYNVDCIDVGGMSTRPIEIYGGKRATIEEELKRVKLALPYLIEIAQSYDIPVALDTQFHEVASYGIQQGIKAINDISGLKKDERLAELIKESGVDLVIMASEKEPGDVCGINNVMNALDKSIKIASKAGIPKNKISIDPGFGGWQGRSKDCDLDILRNFENLKEFGLPIYIGVSRKSTIHTLNGGKLVNDRLAGSLQLTSWLIDQGANIVRTHDVKQTRLMLNVKKGIENLF